MCFFLRKTSFQIRCDETRIIGGWVTLQVWRFFQESNILGSWETRKFMFRNSWETPICCNISLFYTFFFLDFKVIYAKQHILMFSFCWDLIEIDKWSSTSLKTNEWNLRMKVWFKWISFSKKAFLTFHVSCRGSISCFFISYHCHPERRYTIHLFLEPLMAMSKFKTHWIWAVQDIKTCFVSH